MKTYTGYVSTGYVGSKRTFTFTMEDDATEEEIAEAFDEDLLASIYADEDCEND